MQGSRRHREVGQHRRVLGGRESDEGEGGGWQAGTPARAADLRQRGTNEGPATCLQLFDDDLCNVRLANTAGLARKTRGDWLPDNTRTRLPVLAPHPAGPWHARASPPASPGPRPATSPGDEHVAPSERVPQRASLRRVQRILRSPRPRCPPARAPTREPRRSGVGRGQALQPLRVGLGAAPTHPSGGPTGARTSSAARRRGRRRLALRVALRIAPLARPRDRRR